MSTLAETYDALMLDLDGTVYLGGQPIDHVAPALARAKQQGARSVFVTNNASRPPAEVAESLTGMGVAAEPDDVLTSPQAAAVMLTDRHPAGTQGAGHRGAVAGGIGHLAGLQPVRLATDDPAAVVQGHSPETGWRELAEACIALRTGADWVACNVDSTLPTDRGLLPGNGAMVAALIAATGLQPRVAGKPERPLLDAAITAGRLQDVRWSSVTGWTPTSPAPSRPGSPSLLVFTGVSTTQDLLSAVPEQRPTYLAFDLRGLVEEDHAVRIPESSSAGSSLEWTVDVNAGAIVLSSASGPGSDAAAISDASALRALALLTVRAWSSGLTVARAQDAAAAAALERCALKAA